MTPYDFWRRTHSIHHASAGHLERRGIGDVDTLTVREYETLSRLGRLRYRIYRHPVVMFGIGPAYLFVLQQRMPVGMLWGNGRQPWISTMATNLGIAVAAASLIALIGIGPFLLIHLPLVLLAGTAGVWLFYVQHQFETTYWAHATDWTYQDAALHGSSYVLEGEQKDVENMIRWCHRGSPFSDVTAVDVQWLDYTGEFSDFGVRY